MLTTMSANFHLTMTSDKGFNPTGYGAWHGDILDTLGQTEREGQAAPPPQGLVRIGLGGRAAPPPSFSSLFPFLLSYSYYMEGGILRPVGVGLPRARHSRGPALPSSTPLYTGAGGTPETQQLIIDLLAVCGAPLHHNPR